MPEVAEDSPPAEAAAQSAGGVRTAPWVVAFLVAVFAGVLAAAWGINESQDRRSRADANASEPVRPLPSGRDGR